MTRPTTVEEPERQASLSLPDFCAAGAVLVGLIQQLIIRYGQTGIDLPFLSEPFKPSPTLAVTARAQQLRAAGKDVIGLGGDRDLRQWCRAAGRPLPAVGALCDDPR